MSVTWCVYVECTVWQLYRRPFHYIVPPFLPFLPSGSLLPFPSLELPPSLPYPPATSFPSLPFPSLTTGLVSGALWLS